MSFFQTVCDFFTSPAVPQQQPQQKVVSGWQTVLLNPTPLLPSDRKRKTAARRKRK